MKHLMITALIFLCANLNAQEINIEPPSKLDLVHWTKIGNGIIIYYPQPYLYELDSIHVENIPYTRIGKDLILISNQDLIAYHEGKQERNEKRRKELEEKYGVEIEELPDLKESGIFGTVYENDKGYELNNSFFWLFIPIEIFDQVDVNQIAVK